MASEEALFLTHGDREDGDLQDEAQTSHQSIIPVLRISLFLNVVLGAFCVILATIMLESSVSVVDAVADPYCK